ncbi:GDSL-type esterase/lipase family protein [Evansella sp. AB-rgal1]|uniref:GDSL-type esterase/lipase family protein n=1 Tax=Evansella sp. AB-rgal1 TaxID=3242696 RepID=UPI00359EE7E6
MNHHIYYTALGDSLTAGISGLFKKGFVQKYASLLENHLQRPVIPHIFAKPRITSSYLLNMMRTNPEIYRSIYHSSVITITIGGNDLLQANRAYNKTKDFRVFEKAYYTYYENITKIIQLIQSIKKQSNDSEYVIQFIGVYNPFPNLPYGDHWVHQFNSLLASFSNENIIYVDVHSPFSQYGKKVLSLGIHPNGKGYEVMANQLFQSLNTDRDTS